MEILITLAILIFSVIVHEVSHGLMAEKLGDYTARDAGRITINPIPHIDPFGSILLPGLLLAVGSPIVFGSAKPVPVNFENLRPRKLGMALVSIVGPLSNLVLAVLFILPIAFNLVSGPVAGVWLQASILNIVLAVFNVLPIPPLDGSKILASMLPDGIMYKLLEMERYGFLIVLVFLFLGWLDKILLPVINVFLALFNIRV